MNDATVCIVDDDADARFGLRMLLESAGHQVAEYASAEEFLDTFNPTTPSCLILDLQMPTIGGLELQQRLIERDMDPPIIFLTGHANVPSAVKALKGGAVDFLQKPVTDDRELLDRVAEAIRRDAAAMASKQKRETARSLFSTLTPREREVMALICEGKPNKVIAFDLGISERTVELHRSRLMRKLHVRSVAELIERKTALE